MSDSNDTCWIYHERQRAALCGQHALNNLLQACIFSAEELKNIALQLDREELQMYGPPGSPAYVARLAEGSGNVDAYGNFSLQVLQRALATFSTERILLPNIVDETVRDVEATEFEGFICHKDAHWFAIRKIKNRFWNLNSFLPRPEIVSNFKLAAELSGLTKKGYTIFVAVPEKWKEGGKLPPICERDEDRSKGLDKYWWHEKKLAATASVGGINASTANYSYENVNEKEVNDSANATQDPWLNVKGDGKTVGSNLNKAQTSDGRLNYVDPQLFQTLTVNPENKQTAKPTKLQLRLPHKKRLVRVFDKDDTVGYLYKVVLSECQGQPSGKNLQLSGGFPPKVLIEGNKTLEEAGITNSAITCRWI